MASRVVFGLVVLAAAVSAVDVLTIQSGFFGLTKVATFPAGGAQSVLPFVNAAGESKLMVLDTVGNIWVIDDVDGQTPMAATAIMHATGLANTQDLVAFGDTIYLTAGSNIYVVNSDGSLGNGGAPISTGNGDNLFGVVASPVRGKLLIGTSTGYIAYDVGTGLTDTLLTRTAMNLETRGVALTPNYQELLGAVLDTATAAASRVEGFNIGFDDLTPEYRSSSVVNAAGVIAGTGALDGFVFVSTQNGVTEISSTGNQLDIAADASMSQGNMIKYDPKDGSMLIGWSDGLYRLTPPAGAGFAGPTRFVATAFPVGTVCTKNSDCSSQNCATPAPPAMPTPKVCATNGFLGTCQLDSDCTNGGYFCLLPHRRADAIEEHEHHKRGDKHHRDEDGEGRSRRDGRTSRFFRGPFNTNGLYGVCVINACGINNGGCDTNAQCTPTGNADRVCSCNQGFFGEGLDGQCQNPCVNAMPAPCDPQATCISIDADTLRCECNDGFIGTGVTCAVSPCVAANCGPGGTCEAISVGVFQCNCDDGYIQSAPDQSCEVDPCDPDIGTPCPANAFCTSAFPGPTQTCTCEPGYVAHNMMPTAPDYCLPARCAPLTAGVFPLTDIHATNGDCINKVTGDTCHLGCAFGFHPEGNTRATCIAVPNQVGQSVFSISTFSCEANNRFDHDHDHDDDDDDDDDEDRRPRFAWWCGIPAQAPCVPSAPFLDSHNLHGDSLTLHWLALGAQSPLNDQVTSLVVHVVPAHGLAFNTSPIPNPTTATSVTIDGLIPGESYTFRLYVWTFGNANNPGHGLPLFVSL